MKTTITFLFLLVGLLSKSQTYNKLNIELLSVITPNSDTAKSPVGNKYSGCWAWYQAAKNKEYAISGSSDGIYFIDVSSPTSPSVSAFVAGRPGSSWREMKTYLNYCYIVSDDAPPNKFTIVDMQYLPDSVHIVHNGTKYFEKGHTIWIDNDKMYIGATSYTSGSSAMTVWSLATPTAPVLMRRVEQDVAPPVFSYVHDMFVRNDTIYASTGWQGLHILFFDTSDVSFKYLGSYQGYNDAGYNHSSCLTQDGKYLLFCDEIPGELPMHLVDVQNPGNVQPIKSFRPASRSTSHNPFIIGNKWAIVSCYKDGVYIFDISNPQSIKLSGYFDTYPQGGANIGDYPNGSYGGNWGAHPYLPSGIIIANDMQNGVFVLDPSAAYASNSQNVVDIIDYSNFEDRLQIFPNPVSDFLSVSSNSDGPSSVEITAVSGELVFSINYDGPIYDKIDLSKLSNGIYVVCLIENGHRCCKNLFIEH